MKKKTEVASKMSNRDTRLAQRAKERVGEAKFRAKIEKTPANDRLKAILAHKRSLWDKEVKSSSKQLRKTRNVESRREIDHYDRLRQDD